MAYPFGKISKDMEYILQHLSEYPVLKTLPEHTLSFSRNKKIRFLSQKEFVHINKGVIAVERNVKILKSDGKYFFEF